MPLRCLTIALLCLTVSPAVLFSADRQKKVVLRSVDTPPRIDGEIESVWSSADSVSDFFQLQPFFGKAPSKRTTSKLLATESALYCLIISYDERKNIQQITGTLDDFSGDVVSLMLDTFGDRRTAYKFAVSAAGVRSDCRMLDDGRNRDYGWDGVWYSSTRVHDWGYVVEMEIPFRSIQYDETISEWGLDFDRWIPLSNEDLYWNSYMENEGLRISKFGALELNGNSPTVKGLNLEVYPVGIAKAAYIRDGVHSVRPDAGLDIFYNPSQKLTFQLTANPDFAQIEADPFSFNIGRYESYFEERRPFFTQGSEIFMPSGKDRSSGFYQPLELFYSRRIGKVLPDGSEVPLIAGTKAFGRSEDWEYGTFLAMTGARDYIADGERSTEPQAMFGSARVKRQILENSSVGVLMVGKRTAQDMFGVIDVDGAFRSSDWQLSYQLARSVRNDEGDYAASLGFLLMKDTWILGIRSRLIGEDFDIGEVGFVPWQGTSEFTAMCGPRWFFEEGAVREILLYGGGIFNYEAADAYTDRTGALGLNIQFRSNWGMEITYSGGRSKDANITYDSYEINASSWFNVSPRWDGNIYGGYEKTYNFRRDYLSFYAWSGLRFDWKAFDEISVGTSLDAFIEGNPRDEIEDVTLNARPFISATPINNLNLRLYVDNVFVRSSDVVEQMVVGFLFSYNFLPKSWIYFAINEVQDRRQEFSTQGIALPNRLHTADRVSVLKVKYLYNF